MQLASCNCHTVQLQLAGLLLCFLTTLLLKNAELMNTSGCLQVWSFIRPRPRACSMLAGAPL